MSRYTQQVNVPYCPACKQEHAFDLKIEAEESPGRNQKSGEVVVRRACPVLPADAKEATIITMTVPLTSPAGWKIISINSDTETTVVTVLNE